MAVKTSCLIKLGGPREEVVGGQEERKAPRLHLFVSSQLGEERKKVGVCDSLNFLLSLCDL